MKQLAFLLPWLMLAGPAHAQTDLERGFVGALRGCEEWVLNPASWAEGPGPFIATVGLGNTMGLVNSVEQANLPPKELRVANHFWRINSTMDSGYILVVSSQLPICHITGGGNVDLQPDIERVLTSDDFRSHWKEAESRLDNGMVSTSYANVEEPSFSIVISRAMKRAGVWIACSYSQPRRSIWTIDQTERAGSTTPPTLSLFVPTDSADQ